MVGSYAARFHTNLAEPLGELLYLCKELPYILKLRSSFRALLLYCGSTSYLVPRNP
jgi:hypothetical protein